MIRLAGERQRTRAHATGTTIVIVDGREQGLDNDGGRWYVTCEDHGTSCVFDTLAMARYHAPVPNGWCDECQAIVDAREDRQGAWRIGR